MNKDYPNNELLNHVWSVEQNILDVFDSVCKKNHLKYSLAYGTLLGAIRHGGFIPWDDDIDVIMPREDYETLIRLWKNDAPRDYLLETPEEFGDMVNNFAKIRKNHTTFLQFESERSVKHSKGIFIDVFPADRKATNKVSEKIQFALFATNLLFNRGYPGKEHGILGIGERILLRIIPKSLFRGISHAAGKASRKWNSHKDSELVAPNTIKWCKKYYPADSFEHLISWPFNGKEYSIFEDYDRILRVDFGDYMKLPPEDERVWKHHPIIIDFERNYEELDDRKA